MIFNLLCLGMTEMKPVYIASNWTQLNWFLSIWGMGKFKWMSSVNLIQENSEQLSYSRVCKCEPHGWTMVFPNIFPYPYIFPPPVRLWFNGIESCIQLLPSGEQGIVSQGQENKVSSGYIFSAVWLEPSQHGSIPTSSRLCMFKMCFTSVNVWSVHMMFARWDLLMLDTWPELLCTLTRGHKCQIVHYCISSSSYCLWQQHGTHQECELPFLASLTFSLIISEDICPHSYCSCLLSFNKYFSRCLFSVGT